MRCIAGLPACGTTLQHGIDKAYFLYNQNTDICYPTRQLGYTISHWNTATAALVNKKSSFILACAKKVCTYFLKNTTLHKALRN